MFYNVITWLKTLEKSKDCRFYILATLKIILLSDCKKSFSKKMSLSKMVCWLSGKKCRRQHLMCSLILIIKNTI